MKTDLVVNGKQLSLEAPAGQTLLEALRGLGLNSVKKSCETGNCGACTVLLDGRPVASCIMLTAQADGHTVTTVEGLAADGTMIALQRAFVEAGAPQCGFCTPGILLVLAALLKTNPAPTRQEIREAMSGNICRCSGYVKMVDAAERAGRAGRAEGARP